MNKHLPPTPAPLLVMHELVIDHARRLAPDYAGSWNADTRLGKGGAGLDSIGILDLVLGLEQATGRVLRTECLDSGALATVGSLAAFLLAQPAGSQSKRPCKSVPRTD